MIQTTLKCTARYSIQAFYMIEFFFQGQGGGGSTTGAKDFFLYFSPYSLFSKLATFRVFL